MKSFEQFITEFTQSDINRIIQIVDTSIVEFGRNNHLNYVGDNIGKLGIKGHQERDDLLNYDQDENETVATMKNQERRNRPTFDPKYIGGSYTNLPEEFTAFLNATTGIKATKLGEGIASIAFKSSKLDLKESLVLKFTKNQADWHLANTIFSGRLWEKNDLFPRYYMLKKFANTSYFVSVMEPITPADKLLADGITLYRAWDAYLVHKKWTSPQYMNSDNQSTVNMALNKAKYAIEDWEKTNSFSWFNERAVDTKKLFNYFELLNRIYKGRLSMDLHDGNWGIRRDGSPVIFDPTTDKAGSKQSLAGQG